MNELTKGINIHPRYLKHGQLKDYSANPTNHRFNISGSKRRYILKYAYFAAKLRDELSTESQERVMRGNSQRNPTALHY